MEDKMYGVLLTDSQEIKVVQGVFAEDPFDLGRKAIGCDWIELVEPQSLADRNLVLMIDEEGKVKDGVGFVNCVASHLYGSEQHGDVIVGNAVLIKSAGESLEMLTGDEANRLVREMRQLRGPAIESMAGTLKLRPVVREEKPSVRETLKPRHCRPKERQPCKKDSPER